MAAKKKSKSRSYAELKNDMKASLWQGHDDPLITHPIIPEEPIIITDTGHWLQPATTTIHTYFTVCAGINYEEELRLLILWQQIWQRLGYTTIVLNETHAEVHPLYAAYRAKVDTFPTINPREYDRACWLRWLALDAVGGGIMADYDVFPRALRTLPVYDQFTIFERGVPCLAGGTQLAIRQWIEYVMGHPDGYSPDQKHFSDMLCVRGLPSLKTESLCVQYTDTDWLKTSFIHFSHSSTEKVRPRHKNIEALLALK